MVSLPNTRVLIDPYLHPTIILLARTCMLALLVISILFYPILNSLLIWYFYISEKSKEMEKNKKLSFHDWEIFVTTLYNKMILPYEKKHLFYSFLSDFVFISLLFIITAFISDIFVEIGFISPNLLYLIIMALWSLIFVWVFYNFNSVWYFTYGTSKKPYTITILLILFVIGLYINDLKPTNIFSQFNPLEEYSRNIEFQLLLTSKVTKYVKILQDWSLVQGMLHTLLEYSDFGKKRKNSYDKKAENSKLKLDAFLEILNLVKEINNNETLRQPFTDTENTYLENKHLIDAGLFSNKEFKPLRKKVKSTRGADKKLNFFKNELRNYCQKLNELLALADEHLVQILLISYSLYFLLHESFVESLVDNI